jgi:hypothetical protein
MLQRRFHSPLDFEAFLLNFPKKEYWAGLKRLNMGGAVPEGHP